MSERAGDSDEMFSGPIPDGERSDWQKLCAELMAEREDLRKELAEVKKERDLYRKTLQVTLPVEEISFTKEEVFALRGKAPPLHQFLDDLEKELSA